MKSSCHEIDLLVNSANMLCAVPGSHHELSRCADEATRPRPADSADHHTFLTDANVEAVQRTLGPSAAMTLNTYADLFDDDLDAVAVALKSAALLASCLHRAVPE